MLGDRRRFYQAHHDVWDPSWLLRVNTRKDEAASFLINSPTPGICIPGTNPPAPCRTEELLHSSFSPLVPSWSGIYSLPARLAEAGSLGTFKSGLG